MKKYDNFYNCFSVLKSSDRNMAETNEIYRTGIIGQFNLCFELSWKLLQEVMKKHSVMEAHTGSPREIVKTGFKIGFLDNEPAWLLMLKDRNYSVHVYDEDLIDEIIERIFEVYIPALEDFGKKMNEKISELGKDEEK